MYETKSPVLFIIFNRPDTTKKVFEAIKSVKPKRLFIAADGPREGNDNDAKRCQEAKEIALNVDWDCEVKTLLRDKNLGCKKAVYEGISWFFDNVESGVVLEDDCLPSDDFFKFCDEMLERYKDDERIMHVGGGNPVSELSESSEYYFSIYNRIWGWAGWSRAWKHCDVDMNTWVDFKRDKQIDSIFNSNIERKYWAVLWQRVANNEVDTWDYQWFYSRVRQGSYAIAPNVNLVSNIGFGEDATHTTSSEHALANKPFGKLKFPLKHKDYMLRDVKSDNLYYRKYVRKNAIIILIKAVIKKCLFMN
ncbi:MAG: hypothetical protein GY804_01715 [Alphaproteobacteria bacterium]|nr:hypothetical protein [Alphaproteobacteria bacterium]